MRRFKFFLFALLVAPLLMGAQARCSLTRAVPGQTYVAGFVQDKDVGAVNAMFDAAEAAKPKPVVRAHE
jgi:hypothetical protein